MGLDMYMRRKTYVGNHHKDANKDKLTITGPNPTNIKSERISEITESVAYWRKANAIHRWFVQNVQGGIDDCREYDVTKDQLRELLAIVTKIVDDPNVASFVLPTQDGFFFGDTNYDDFYLDDIKETKRMLTDILAEDTGGVYYTYQSSW